MPTLYQVYVLQNSEGRFYVGLTENIQTRLAQHNAGESKWTAKYRPWSVVWKSEDMTLYEARKFENLLKRQKGGLGFYQATGLSPSGS